MPDRTKRCYLYIRVSTDKQEEEGYSLPEQEDRLNAETSRRACRFADTFADKGISDRIIDD